MWASILTLRLGGKTKPALANIIYNLSGVTLTGGGSLTGTFTTNDARTTLITYDFFAPVSGLFTGFEYKPSNSSVTASSLPASFFQLDDATSAHELRILFSSPLTAQGATLTTTSYEAEPGAGSRTVTAGSAVAATPEPQTSALIGFALVGLASWRVRKARISSTLRPSTDISSSEVSLA